MVNLDLSIQNHKKCHYMKFKLCLQTLDCYSLLGCAAVADACNQNSTKTNSGPTRSAKAKSSDKHRPLSENSSWFHPIILWIVSIYLGFLIIFLELWISLEMSFELNCEFLNLQRHLSAEEFFFTFDGASPLKKDDNHAICWRKNRAI